MPDAEETERKNLVLPFGKLPKREKFRTARGDLVVLVGIECSVMATEITWRYHRHPWWRADLEFPHTIPMKCSIRSQNWQDLLTTGLHNGFVNVDNEKMSKSLGQLL